MQGDLDELRAFVEVVGRGGFAAAARQLHTTPTVINRRVTRLEAGLRTRLLVRSTLGAEPTEAGAAFHERCVQLLGELDEACQDARGDGAEPAGLLKLSAPSSLERLLVQPVVSRLMRSHPLLRFELTLGDRRIDQSAHQADLSIRGGPLDDSSLVARRLALVPVVLAASPAYLARCGEPDGPEALAGHCLLEHAEVGLVQSWRDPSLPAAQLPRPRQRMVINGFEALVDLAVDGMGICVASQVQLAQELADGRLRRVLPQLPLAESPLWAVFPTSRHPSRRLRLLLEAFATYAAQPFERWGEPMEPPA